MARPVRDPTRPGRRDRVRLSARPEVAELARKAAEAAGMPLTLWLEAAIVHAAKPPVALP
jgi:hypothetical protein